MLRRTHVYKYMTNASLLADTNGTPIEVTDRTGYSVIASWSEAAGAVKTFHSGVAEVTNITAQADVGRRETSTVACLAEAGKLESAVVTFPNTAGTTQADYIVVSNVAGTQWAVWMDIDAAGTAPTGAAFLAVTAGNRKKASIVTGGTAAQAGAAVVAALGTLTNITVTDNLDGTVTFAQTKMGNATDIAPHNADDSGAGSATVLTTDGHAATVNNTYFTLSSINSVTKAQKNFYVWFNTNSEGTDPAIAGKTGVAVALSPEAADTAVATAVKNALGALTNDFATSAPAATVTITNVKLGSVPDVADGTAATGFAFNVTVQGVNSNLNNKYFTVNNALDANPQYGWFNVDGLGTDPAVAGKTGVALAITYGSQANTDVANVMAAATFTGMTQGAVGPVVTFTNSATGATTDATAGTSGFTVSVTAQGVTTAVDQTGDTVTVPSHGFTTGQKLAATSSGALPTGIPATAYAIVLDQNTLQFATSKSNALLGTFVNISSDGTGTQTLTRAALDGTLKLQASNDYDPTVKPVAAGTWSDVTGSSISMVGISSYGWNVSDVYYAWARLVYTATDGDGTINASACVKD